MTADYQGSYGDKIVLEIMAKHAHITVLFNHVAVMVELELELLFRCAFFLRGSEIFYYQIRYAADDKQRRKHRQRVCGLFCVFRVERDRDAVICGEKSRVYHQACDRREFVEGFRDVCSSVLSDYQCGDGEYN